jgi:hypothetical protein
MFLGCFCVGFYTSLGSSENIFAISGLSWGLAGWLAGWMAGWLAGWLAD